MPTITVALIVANVAIQAALALLPAAERAALLRAAGAVPSALWLQPPGGRAVAPPLTVLSSLFLHGGWLHLAGNMWFLWLFGERIERLLGSSRFLALYLGAGALAALLQAGVDRASDVPMVGASGAVAGVLGAYAAAFPRARVRCLLLLFIFIQVVTVPAWVLLSLWFLAQLVSSIGAGSAEGGVAWFAHVGGFVIGLLVARPLRGARRPGGAPEVYT